MFAELRRRDWSIFHQPIAHVTGKPWTAVYEGRATGCVGSVDHIQPVAGMAATFRIEGWTYDLQAPSRVGDIVFLGPDGVIRGVGRTISTRDDVSKARPDISDPLTGWFGFYRADGVSPDRIDAYAVVRRGDHSALCKLAR